MHLNCLIFLVLCIINKKSNCVQWFETHDETMSIYSKGIDLVNAVMQKVNYFTNSSSTRNHCWRRMALAESNAGMDPGYRAEDGVWQFFQSGDLVFDTGTPSEPQESEATFIWNSEAAFNMCFNCLDNFSLPIFSAVYSKTQIIYRGAPSTGNVSAQAYWWVMKYQTLKLKERTEDNFVKRALTYDVEYGCRNDLKVDVWFLLGTSWSVSDAEFQTSLDFLYSVAYNFSGPPSRIRFGYSIYFYNHSIEFQFEDYTGLASLKASFDGVNRHPYRTQTGSALLRVLSEGFNESAGARSDAMRILVLITSGSSGDDISGPIEQLKEEDVIIYCFGVGDGVNQAQLNEIASRPTDKYLFQSDTLDELDETSFLEARRIQICNDVVAAAVYAWMKTELKDNPSSYTDADELLAATRTQFSFSCFPCSYASGLRIQDDVENIFSQNNKVIGGTYGQNFKENLILWMDDNSQDCFDDHKLDMWFLLDNVENYTNEEYMSAINFMENFVNEVNDRISHAERLRVGYSVSYASEYDTFMKLEETTSFAAFIRITGYAAKPESKGYIGKAIKDVDDNWFSSSSGARIGDDEVGRFLIILLDGSSHDDFVAPATEIQNKNVTIISIGIGNNINLTALREINSVNPYLSKTIPTFDSLLNLTTTTVAVVHRQMYDNVCNLHIDLPLNVEVVVPLTNGRRRHLETQILKDRVLVIQFESTANVNGKGYMSGVISEPNSAYYDFALDLLEGIEIMWIKGSSLPERYPSLSTNNTNNSSDNWLNFYISVVNGGDVDFVVKIFAYLILEEDLESTTPRVRTSSASYSSSSNDQQSSSNVDTGENGTGSNGNSDGSNDNSDQQILADDQGNPINENTSNVNDENGNPASTNVIDENGNPVPINVFDENGTQITTTRVDGNGNPIRTNVFDENGNIITAPVFDRNGSPINENPSTVSDENRNPVSTNVIDENGNPVPINVFDENGTQITTTRFDGNGNPIRTNVFDENGNIITAPVFDQNGSPINDGGGNETHFANGTLVGYDFQIRDSNGDGISDTIGSKDFQTAATSMTWIIPVIAALLLGTLTIIFFLYKRRKKRQKVHAENAEKTTTQDMKESDYGGGETGAFANKAAIVNSVNETVAKKAADKLADEIVTGVLSGFFMPMVAKKSESEVKNNPDSLSQASCDVKPEEKSDFRKQNVSQDENLAETEDRNSEITQSELNKTITNHEELENKALVGMETNDKKDPSDTYVPVAKDINVLENKNISNVQDAEVSLASAISTDAEVSEHNNSALVTALPKLNEARSSNETDTMMNLNPVKQTTAPIVTEAKEMSKMPLHANSVSSEHENSPENAEVSVSTADKNISNQQKAETIETALLTGVVSNDKKSSENTNKLTSGPAAHSEEQEAQPDAENTNAFAKSTLENKEETSQRFNEEIQDTADTSLLINSSTAINGNEFANSKNMKRSTSPLSKPAVDDVLNGRNNEDSSSISDADTQNETQENIETKVLKEKSGYIEKSKERKEDMKTKPDGASALEEREPPMPDIPDKSIFGNLVQSNRRRSSLIPDQKMGMVLGGRKRDSLLGGTRRNSVFAQPAEKALKGGLQKSNEQENFFRELANTEQVSYSEKEKFTTKEEAEDSGKRNKLATNISTKMDDLIDNLHNDAIPITQLIAMKNEIKESLEEFKRSFGSQPIPSKAKKYIEAVERKLIDITLYILTLRLTRAIHMRDGTKLQTGLDAVTTALDENDVTQADVNRCEALVANIKRAKDLLSLFEQLERMKSVVMSLKQTTISEVRSYSNPPDAIRKVMEATYILLGEEHEKIRSWKLVQGLIGRTGKGAIKRRVLERNIVDISYADAEAANELVKDLVTEEVEIVSKAAAVFFTWVLSVEGEVRDRLAGSAEA